MITYYLPDGPSAPRPRLALRHQSYQQQMKTITTAALLLLAAWQWTPYAMGQSVATVAESTQTHMQTPQETGSVVDILTTAGTIKVRLYDDTPLHRDNFLKLASEGFYDGVLFHRVISDFMVQAGDPDSKEAAPGARLGAGDPGYTIEAEIDYPRHYHKRGALAAARTGDQFNPERRSSGSQFYIVTGRPVTAVQLDAMAARQTDQLMQNYFRRLCSEHAAEIEELRKAGDSEKLEALRQNLIAETEKNVKPVELTEEMKAAYAAAGGTPSLDAQYTVFGEVIEGMDVVEKIEKAATDSSDRPLEDIRILSMKVEKESEKNN